MRTLRVASFTLLALLVPLAAYAQSTNDLTALLAQITALEQQINSLAGTTSVTTATNVSVPSSQPSNSSASCPSLSRTISFGSTGSDVSSLQAFLITKGFLQATATGYFGNLTQSAVANWQESNEVVAGGDAVSTGLGIAGPKTRAAIFASCVDSHPALPTAPAKQCLPVSQPQTDCPTGWQPVDDAAGCATYYQCSISLPSTSNPYSTSTASPTTPASCPVVQQPICSGTVTPFQTSANGCVVSYQCSI